jgi:hypothetical protein
VVTVSHIYVSSRIKFAQMWLDLKVQYPLIHATWLLTTPPLSPNDWKRLWDACLVEAKTAGALVLYAPDEEVLKGALVEVGAALSHNVPVFYVGLEGRLPLGNLINNPYILRRDTLESALEDATKLLIGTAQ